VAIIKLYMKFMERVNKCLYLTLGTLIGMTFAILISQIFTRYVINASLHWTEEAARFLTVWTVFLGVAVALREKSLIAVEVVVQFVPKKIESIFRFIVLLVSMLLMIYLIFLGTQLSLHAADQSATALGIPMWIPYAAIPVGSLFTLLNIFVVMIEIFTKKEAEAS
jgi:TRAP-type transport system small permease protein